MSEAKVKPKKRNDEGRLQSAVIASLETYCFGRQVGFVHHAPYANQQGDQMRKYCADVIGVLDSSFVILLELKYYDCESKLLPEFDLTQFNENLELEEIGVPIGYAYNNVQKLEYFRSDRDQVRWPSLTLEQINRCPPSHLPDESPTVSAHHTLLAWLDAAKAAGTGNSQMDVFGKILGFEAEPSHMRNGVLALLYGVDRDVLHALDGNDLRKIYDYLTRNPRLEPKHERDIKLILDSAADVFNRFTSKNNPPKPRAKRGPRT